jgi:hypothetical protein
LLVVFVIQRNSVIGAFHGAQSARTNDQLLVRKSPKLFNGIRYGDIITVSTANCRTMTVGPTSSNALSAARRYHRDQAGRRLPQWREDRRNQGYLPSGTETKSATWLLPK